MTHSPVLLVHICAATVGLLSGYLAMLFRKGSGRHGAAGSVFLVSMLTMSLTGAYVAAFLRPNALNVVAALLTFYLVSTAWWAAKRGEGTGAFDRVALLFIAVVGAYALMSGIQAATSSTGTRHGMSAFIYFVFAFATLLCVRSDIRMLKRGGVSGGRRIGRHLLRMCFALMIATFSLYPGQAKLFPPWLRETNLLIVPHVLLIGSMIFWSVRVMGRRRASQNNAIGATHASTAVAAGLPGAV
ncbi:MAG TPA: hypothetical protein VEK57_27870 [Thermoanaerobaculia bacterium]|nr:hypothetical protein [Thermoanaerobaculia bacterium]